METYKDHIIQSPDINAERLETLRNMFPDWFTQEGKLDIALMKPNVMSSVGLANQKPNAMPSCQLEQHYIMMKSGV